ncbi:MAG: ABC transporter permease [Acidimicrobiia bacterium]
MRSRALATRNFIEVWRDPLSLSLTVALPVGMLLVLQLLGDVDDFFTVTSVAPGAILFGFVMLMFSEALSLTRDRESALFSRLLTAPLRPGEFVSGYSVPYLPVAIIQAVALLAVAWVIGLESSGSLWLVALILLIMAVMYIGWGMILGVSFSTKTVTFPYMAILLLTIFGGAWMDLEAIGGVFKTVGDWFPFAHALDAMRDVLIDGVGFTSITTDLYWVFGYTVVTTLLAVLVFRRRMIE